MKNLDREVVTYEHLALCYIMANAKLNHLPVPFSNLKYVPGVESGMNPITYKRCITKLGNEIQGKKNVFEEVSYPFLVKSLASFQSMTLDQVKEIACTLFTIANRKHGLKLYRNRHINVYDKRLPKIKKLAKDYVPELTYAEKCLAAETTRLQIIENKKYFLKLAIKEKEIRKIKRQQDIVNKEKEIKSEFKTYKPGGNIWNNLF